MGQPVVHFEIIGNDPEKLRGYYGDLFPDESGKSFALAVISALLFFQHRQPFVDRHSCPLCGSARAGC